MSDNDEKSPFKPFEAALDLSKKLIDWALLILGGSIALLLGTSHASPASFWLRLVYILFPVGWVCLAISMNYGVRAQRAYLALLFGADPPAQEKKEERLDRAKQILTAETFRQMRYLKAGLLIFGLWLIVYMGWWITGINFHSSK